MCNHFRARFARRLTGRYSPKMSGRSSPRGTAPPVATSISSARPGLIDVVPLRHWETACD